MRQERCVGRLVFSNGKGIRNCEAPGIARRVGALCCIAAVVACSHLPTLAEVRTDAVYVLHVQEHVETLKEAVALNPERLAKKVDKVQGGACGLRLLPKPVRAARV